MNIRVHNCFSQLDSYTPELEEMMAVAHDNYWFSKKYKIGLWDGKTHFLKLPSMRFPTGLLFLVTEFCREMDTPYQIIDERRAPIAGPIGELTPDLLNGIQLRDYQEEAIVTALAMERGCLEMATGSGKTEVAAGIIKLLPLRTLFLVHTRDLLRQTHARFEKRLGTEVGKFGEGQHDTEATICVATVQSIDSWLKREERAAKDWLKSFQMLFLDECHHASANIWYRACLLTHGAYYRFGLSGTILRRDNLSNTKMLAAFGETIYRLPSHELIQRGYLSGIEMKLIPNPEVVTGSSWQDVYERGVVRSERRNGLILDLVKKEFAVHKKIMVLVRQIEHGNILLQMMTDAGLPAVFLSGGNSSEERATAIADFLKGDRFIIIASTIFDEGVDIPAINVLVVAAGGKSEIRAIQRPGRGLRRKEDMSHLTVYDFMDSSRFLKTHSARRRSVYKKEKFM